MEPIRDYLTKRGWKRDWDQTKQDFSNTHYNSRSDLSNFARNEKGSTSTAMMFTTISLAMSNVGLAPCYRGEGANLALVVGSIFVGSFAVIDAFRSSYKDSRENKEKLS